MALLFKAYTGVTCTYCGHSGRRQIELRGPGVFKIGCYICKVIGIHLYLDDDGFVIEHKKQPSKMNITMADRTIEDVD